MYEAEKQVAIAGLRQAYAEAPATPEELPMRTSEQVPCHEKVARRWDAIAATLQNEADHKFAPRQENTAKRARERRSARIEGYNLERAACAATALASGWRSGQLPNALRIIRYKSHIVALARHCTSRNDHGDLIDTDDPQDNSTLGISLREFVATQKTEAEVEIEQERRRVFDITERVTQLKLKGIPGYFPTPLDVAKVMLDMSCIHAGDKVLEPSAGTGELAEAILAHEPHCHLDCIELCTEFCDLLKMRELPAITNADFLGWVILQPGHLRQYNQVVMNPPFENHQDIAHVYAAHDCLKLGGRLVAVMSSHTFSNSDKKSTEFRTWLKERYHEIIDVPAGSFKESGTSVSARIVVIDKSPNDENLKERFA